MKSRKRTRCTEITVERSEIFVIRKPKRFILAWCAECAKQVQMVTPEEGASMSQVSTRTIYRWVDTSKVHFTENEQGLLLICLDSLLHEAG